MFSTSVITPPTDEPVTLDQAVDHCRAVQGTEDQWFEDNIKAAREYCEANILGGRSLMPTTLELILPRFYSKVEFPNPPLQSITSVTYYDSGNTSKTLASTEWIVVAPTSGIGYMVPAVNAVWPDVSSRPDALRIRYVAGYASAALVPAKIKKAILLLVCHWYENREASLVGTISKEAEFSVMKLLRSSGYGFV